MLVNRKNMLHRKIYYKLVDCLGNWLKNRRAADPLSGYWYCKAPKAVLIELSFSWGRANQTVNLIIIAFAPAVNCAWAVTATRKRSTWTRYINAYSRVEIIRDIAPVRPGPLLSFSLQERARNRLCRNLYWNSNKELRRLASYYAPSNFYVPAHVPYL